MQRLQCAVLAMRWLQACPACLARCFARMRLLLHAEEQCEQFRCSCSVAYQVQLQAFANRWSLAACGVWMHPLQSRYGRIPGYEACFSLRTGFGPRGERQRTAPLLIMVI